MPRIVVNPSPAPVVTSSLAATLTPRQRTFILLALSLGGFAIGTSEFASMGLMLDISRGLSITEAQVGHLISAYAIGVVVGAPVLAFAGAGISRRSLLLGLMGFYAIGNLASALAPSYPTMLLARFVAGLPHGAYFGVAMLVAASISPPAQRGAAVSKVLLGLSVAILVGNPLTTWLGQQFTWRTAFALVSLLALATVVMVARHLAPDPNEVRTSPMRELRAFNTTQVWLALAIGSIGFAGMFCVFTYLAPTLVHVTGINERWMPAAVGLFGVGAIIGNMMGGWLVDRLQFRAAGVLLAWSVVVLLLFPLAAHTAWAMVPAIIAVGTMGALAVALQTRLMDAAGEAQTLAAASNHAAFNTANALGPWLGGMAIGGGFGYASTGYVGAATAAAGLLLWGVSVLIERRRGAGSLAAAASNG
ncbi:MFS transporter [Stenotrophomonas sp. WHRI 8082]|uniref:MFS transporter n=1 Tax=Stenotrophomonas sp. WHRI 8082 TaxID=3162571 RepID=UPI0032EF7FFA